MWVLEISVYILKTILSERLLTFQQTFTQILNEEFNFT